MVNSKIDNPIWTFEEILEFTLEEIESILFDLHEENYLMGNLPLVLNGESACKVKFEKETYIVQFEDDHKEFIRIDKTDHTLTIQGEWWYKGSYSLQRSGNKTHIKLEVFNAAEKFRWAASIMILPEKQKHQANFEVLVSRIKNKLSI